MRQDFFVFLAAGCLTWATVRCPAQRPTRPHPSGDGLRGEYFNGPNFEKKVLTRTDP